MSPRIGNQVFDVLRKGSAAGSVNQRMVLAARCLGIPPETQFESCSLAGNLP